MKIYQGECISKLLEFKSNYFDSVLADPPYNHPNVKPIATKYSKQKNLIGFEGDNKTVGIKYWMHLWMSQCYRVLKEGELFFCFSDWRRIGETHSAMETANFNVLGLIVWDKGNSRPQRGRFRQQTEFCLYASKGHRPPVGAVRPAIFKQSNVPHTKKLHQVEKPVNLLEELLFFCPKGGKVLDPFCGSGSTGDACKNLGLDFIGIEMNEHYAEIAQKRLGIAS